MANKSRYILQQHEPRPYYSRPWIFVKEFANRTNLLEALEIAEKENPDKVFRGIVKVYETIYNEDFMEKCKRIKLKTRRGV